MCTGIPKGSATAVVEAMTGLHRDATAIAAALFGLVSHRVDLLPIRASTLWTDVSR